ncbi:uncharacterized protein LOC128092318 [Culex pipiens pallens]|uniref:uncharacterized protein LOC128092318 n=1 Tax=Culex pipiens pallens TaxID=42434 RepID=UPI0022AA17CD|nr:uncharacterized protein LOC128092318 [Culex pipiens pallens]
MSTTANAVAIVVATTSVVVILATDEPAPATASNYCTNIVSPPPEFLDGPSVRKPQVLELTYSDYFQRLERDPTNLIKNIYLEYRRSHRWNICVFLEGGRSDRELSVQALYFPAEKRRLPFPNQQPMANTSKPVLMMAGNETTLFSTTLSRSKMKAAMLLPNETSIRNLLSMGPSDVTGGVP